MRSRLGNTGTLIDLMELLLFALIFAALFLGVHNIVNGSSYFQGFFAKDNAHLVEALHAVPSGELTVAYLWNNPSFAIEFVPGKVNVWSIKERDEERRLKTMQSKAFGTSGSTFVETETAFTPRFYALEETRGVPRTISVDISFNELRCPAAQVLDGLAISAEVSGFPSEPDKLAAGVREAIKLQRQSAGAGLTDSGPHVHVFVRAAPTQQAGVYYANSDDITLRLACVLTKALGAQSAVRFAHVSQAPRYTNEDADVLIILESTDITQATRMLDQVKVGVLAYWEVDS